MERGRRMTPMAFPTAGLRDGIEVTCIYNRVVRPWRGHTRALVWATTAQLTNGRGTSHIFTPLPLTGEACSLISMYSSTNLGILCGEVTQPF